MIIDCIKRKFRCERTIKELEEYRALVEDHYAFMAKGLPSMEDMIIKDQAIRASLSDMVLKFEEQTGKPLRINPTSVSHARLVPVSYSFYRIPEAVYREIEKRSMVDRFKNLFDVNGRSYICVNFALSFWGELKAGPWWDLAMGVSGIPGHQCNLVWYSDRPDMVLREPQTDLEMSTGVDKVGYLMI